MDSSPTLTPACNWCGASVQRANFELHQEWHRAHRLHSPGCAVTRHRIEQAGTGLYVVPEPCDCGLVEATS